MAPGGKPPGFAFLLLIAPSTEAVRVQVDVGAATRYLLLIIWSVPAVRSHLHVSHEHFSFPTARACCACLAHGALRGSRATRIRLPESEQDRYRRRLHPGPRTTASEPSRGGHCPSRTIRAAQRRCGNRNAARSGLGCRRTPCGSDRPATADDIAPSGLYARVSGARGSISESRGGRAGHCSARERR